MDVPHHNVFFSEYTSRTKHVPTNMTTLYFYIVKCKMHINNGMDVTERSDVTLHKLGEELCQLVVDLSVQGSFLYCFFDYTPQRKNLGLLSDVSYGGQFEYIRTVLKKCQ